jgi:hypothetical protein
VAHAKTPGHDRTNARPRRPDVGEPSISMSMLDGIHHTVAAAAARGLAPADTRLVASCQTVRKSSTMVRICARTPATLANRALGPYQAVCQARRRVVACRWPGSSSARGCRGPAPPLGRLVEHAIDGTGGVNVPHHPGMSASTGRTASDCGTRLLTAGVERDVARLGGIARDPGLDGWILAEIEAALIGDVRVSVERDVGEAGAVRQRRDARRGEDAAAAQTTWFPRRMRMRGTLGRRAATALQSVFMSTSSPAS